MTDLSTTFLGLPLKNPIVAAASPLSKKLDSVRKLEDAGASAVVMYSLFEEQIAHESRALDFFLNQGTESYSEALTYFPEMESYNIGPEGYLDLIQKIKGSIQIPIIASLNGISNGGWVDYAARIEQAGADALELNIYSISTDIDMEGQEIEHAHIDLVSEIRSKIRIPLSVKLSPFFTSIPNICKRLVSAGADGLVLFNRFYQPDLDIETLEVVPTLLLSTSAELRMPLRWIAILYNKIETDLALTSGVHNAQDILKSVMAGANVVQMASELLANGTDRIPAMLADLGEWMGRFEYDSIRQMRGSMSQQAVSDPAEFERANYMKALTSFDNRVK